MNAGKFIYALIQLDDIPDEVMNSAMIGMVYSPSQVTASNSPATGSTGSATGSTAQVKAGGLKNLGRVTED
jgi:hypothetical protein